MPPQVLEWFQCKKCGRRQRWIADNAGKEITCQCGAQIVCPAGPSMDDSSLRTATGVLSDTLVEDVDAAAESAIAASDSTQTLRRIGVERAEVHRRLMTPQERIATKQAMIWLGVALMGLTVLVYALFLMPYRNWWTTTIAVVFGLFTLWKFNKARLRWQKGRPIMEALSHSLGAETE
jgi:uncharacterized membrane protein YqjE